MQSLIERWPVDRLMPYSRNARTHSEEQVAQIAASIATVEAPYRKLRKNRPHRRVLNLIDTLRELNSRVDDAVALREETVTGRPLRFPLPGLIRTQNHFDPAAAIISFSAGEVCDPAIANRILAAPGCKSAGKVIRTR